jgi:hypothetical protein
MEIQPVGKLLELRAGTARDAGQQALFHVDRPIDNASGMLTEIGVPI